MNFSLDRWGNETDRFNLMFLNVGKYLRPSEGNDLINNRPVLALFRIEEELSYLRLSKNRKCIKVYIYEGIENAIMKCVGNFFGS